MRKMASSGKDIHFRWSYRFARSLAWTLGTLSTLVVFLYLVALADERYESRRGLRTYQQVLTVRLGDTVPEFNRKVRGCKIDQNDGEYECVVQPITNRLLGHIDWYMMHRYEDAYVWQTLHRQRIGLRDWMFRLSIRVHQGRVTELHSQFFVVGREMMVGCSWALRPELDHDGVHANTSLHSTNITSSWSGRGYRMEFTPASEQSDLRMREVNGSCLTSFVGCRDSRELLLNLPSADHPEYW